MVTYKVYNKERLNTDAIIEGTSILSYPVLTKMTETGLWGSSHDTDLWCIYQLKHELVLSGSDIKTKPDWVVIKTFPDYKIADARLFLERLQVGVLS
jgi:hypothetical protein